MPPTPLNDARRYTVIPRTLIFLYRGDEVLLLRGAATKRLWAGKYNGIGGHIEAGESPLESARRELREETGLEAELTLRAVIHVTFPHPPGVMLFVFVGEAPPAAQPRPSHEGTPEWIAVQARERVQLVDDLPWLLPRILRPGPLLFLRYFFDEEGDLIIKGGEVL